MEKSEESVNSRENLTCLNSKDPSLLQYNQMQNEQTIYPVNDMREFHKVTNVLDTSANTQSRTADFVVKTFFQLTYLPFYKDNGLFQYNSS